MTLARRRRGARGRRSWSRTACSASTTATYYDTFDGLLSTAPGLSLVHEDGRLSLVERGVRAGASVAAPPPPPDKPCFAGDLEPGPLRDALRELTDVARAASARAASTLRERAMSRARRRGEDRRAPGARGASLAGPAGAGSPLRPRLRLTAVRGYDESCAARPATRCEQELGFTPAEEPLVDEAVRVAGGVPGGIPSKIDVPLRARASAPTSPPRPSCARCSR